MTYEFIKSAMRDPQVVGIDSEFDENTSLFKTSIDESFKWDLVNSGDVLIKKLTPRVEDYLQKQIETGEPNPWDVQQEIDAVPFQSLNGLVIGNSRPSEIIKYAQNKDPNAEMTEEELNFYGKFADQLKQKGFNVNQKDLQDIVLGQYIADNKKISELESEHSWIGNFFIGGSGEMIGDFFSNPMRFWSGLSGESVASAIGVGVLAGGELALGQPELVPPTVSSLVRIGSGIVGFAGADAILNEKIANKRREELGLPSVSSSDLFKNEVLLGAGLATAFKGLAGVRNKFLRDIETRAYYNAQDTFGRYKRTGTDTDSELLRRMQTPENPTGNEEIILRDLRKNTPAWTYESDPSIPELNRNAFNLVPILMKGTDFAENLNPVFQDRMRKFMGKFSESDNLVWSYASGIAKNSEENLKSFKDALKKSSTKDEYVKYLRNIVKNNEKEISLNTKRPKNQTFDEARLFREGIGYKAQEHLMTLLQEEGEEVIDVGQTVYEGFSPNNPYNSRIENSVTEDAKQFEISQGALWERALFSARENGYRGGKKGFTASSFLTSTIQKLNSYSSWTNNLRAENQILSDALDGISADEIYNAYFGRSTSAKGSTVHKTLQKLKSDYRDLLKEYGIEFGEIENHIPQKWSPEAIKSKGFEKWNEEVFPLLDHEKTRKSYYYKSIEKLRKLESDPKTDPEKLKLKRLAVQSFGRKEMAQIYNNLTTDRLTNEATSGFIPKGGVKNRRILHFLGTKEFDKANMLYGTTPDIRLLIKRDFESTIRRIARLKSLDGSAEIFTQDVENMLTAILNGRELTSKEKILKRVVDDNISYVSGGQKRPAMGVSGAVNKLFLSMVRASVLGGAGVTTLIEDAIQASFIGHEVGWGYFNTLKHYVKSISKIKISKEEATRLLVHLEDIETMYADEVARETTSQTARKIEDISKKIDKFTFKISGMQYLTDRGRIGFNKMFLDDIARLRDRPRMQELLKDFGFNDKDFGLLQSQEMGSDGYLNFSSEFQKSSTYTKLLKALYSTQRLAIANTSQSMKAMMSQGGAIGSTLGVMNSLFFLKRIPTQIWFDNLLIPIMKGQYGKVASWSLQMMIASAIITSIKSLALGYKPDPEDPNFYKTIISRSSVMPPLFGDFIFEQKVNRSSLISAVGKSFLGGYSPVLDATVTTADILNKENDRIPHDFIQLLKDFAPLRNHPASAYLWQRFVFDNMQLALDPKAYSRMAGYEKYKKDAGLKKIF